MLKKQYAVSSNSVVSKNSAIEFIFCFILFIGVCVPSFAQTSISALWGFTTNSVNGEIHDLDQVSYYNDGLNAVRYDVLVATRPLPNAALSDAKVTIYRLDPNGNLVWAHTESLIYRASDITTIPDVNQDFINDIAFTSKGSTNTPTQVLVLSGADGSNIDSVQLPDLSAPVRDAPPKVKTYAEKDLNGNGKNEIIILETTFDQLIVYE